MLHSMTGFASKEFNITAPTGEQSTMSINLKSLNARFFESTIKLPPSLLHLETTLFKLFRAAFVRGNIYCTVYLSNAALFEGSVKPALGMVTAYKNAIETIREHLDLSQPITLDNILRMPTIFSTTAPSIDTETEKLFLQEVHNVIATVITERTSEGNELLKDFQERIAVITSELGTIEERSIRFIEEKKQHVRDTLQMIGAETTSLSTAQKDAVYTILDKIDIHEEVTRIKSHIENFLATLTRTTIEKGKRLDFILQELGRETNTIAAKCSESHISSCAINMKVEIEKMREQAQNIV